MDSFKHDELVRFQGMIQDIDNPEQYVKQYEIFDKVSKTASTKSGEYADVLLPEVRRIFVLDLY